MWRINMMYRNLLWSFFRTQVIWAPLAHKLQFRWSGFWSITKNQQFGYPHTYLGGKYIGVGPEVEPAGTILISCDSWIASFFLVSPCMHNNISVIYMSVQHGKYTRDCIVDSERSTLSFHGCNVIGVTIFASVLVMSIPLANITSVMSLLACCAAIALSTPFEPHILPSTNSGH
jgi:hypothetical protein